MSVAVSAALVPRGVAVGPAARRNRGVTRASAGQTTRRAFLALVGAPLAVPATRARADEGGPAPLEVPYTKYAVERASKEDAMELAKALKALPEGRVKGYGAFWCEGCNKQKEILGKEATDMLFESGVLVECYPEGVRKNVPGKEDITKPAGVCTGFDKPGWPLWVVTDESGKELRRVTGIKTVEQLEVALVGGGGVVGDVFAGAKSLVDRNLISGERMF